MVSPNVPLRKNQKSDPLDGIVKGLVLKLFSTCFLWGILERTQKMDWKLEPRLPVNRRSLEYIKQGQFMFLFFS